MIDLSGHARLVFLDRPDLDRDPELYPAQSL